MTSRGWKKIWSIVVGSGILLPLPGIWQPAAADPTNRKIFSPALNANAVALDATRNWFYVGLSATSNNLMLVPLDSNGDTLTPVSYTRGNSVQNLALNSSLNRLYMACDDSPGSEIHSLTLNPATGEVTTFRGYDMNSAGALCLALDPVRQRMYFGLNNGAGVEFVRLDASGDPNVFSTNSSDGSAVNAMALDTERRKLYLGCADGRIRTQPLDANGDWGAVLSTYNFGETQPLSSLALDSTRNLLYVGVMSGGNVHTINLQDNSSGDPGLPVSVASTFPVGVPVQSLTLDATQRRLYLGVIAGGTDLRWVDLDASGLPSGAVTAIASGGRVKAAALDAKRQRLYTASQGGDSSTYQLSEAALPALWINNGEAGTTVTAVDLKWCVPNAHYVRVESSGLQDFYFPLSYSANTSFGQWLSADSQRWSNDGTSRALTRTVKATLSSGLGLKTVQVWFMESAGSSNVQSVIRQEQASITLNNPPLDSPTVTPTSTQTPTGTPTFTSTPTLTASPTATMTLTGTPTVTETRTPTISATATISATYTLTATVSASPSQTPSRTPTPVITPAATGTLTCSPSATPTLSRHEAFRLYPALVRLSQGETVQLQVQLLQAGRVRLRIYDLTGRRIATVTDNLLGPGAHFFAWDGTGAGSGTYLAIAEAAGRTYKRKIVVVR